MQTILFLIYLLFFCWLITRISFFAHAGIAKRWLLGLYLVKIAAGFAYAYFFSLPQYVATADTWGFYKESVKETEWLMRDPAGFVSDLFHYPYAESGNLFAGASSYWNDLKNNVFIKFAALVNVFTNRDYYTNIIVFNFLYFFGPVALFRLVVPLWRYHPYWLLLPVFLLPSFLFWYSGFHKDGLLFAAMMLLLYSLQKQFEQRRYVWRYALLALLCAVALFALRNAVLLLLLPVCIAWYGSRHHPQYKWWWFGVVYGVGLLLFFTSMHLSPSLHFPQYIAGKQAEFNALSGTSKLKVPALQPTAAGFLSFLPYALDIAFLRPHVADIQSFSYVPAIAENGLVLAVMVLWIFCHKPLQTMEPLLLVMIVFSLSMLLLCGYTVTFSGAVVRYKSLVTPVLLTALLITIRWKDFGFKKIRKNFNSIFFYFL